MLKRFALTALLCLVLSGFGAHPAFADIYKYVNEKGEIGIADNLESVPEKYRATAVNTTALEELNKVQLQPQTQHQTLTGQPVQLVQPGTLTTPPNIATIPKALLDGPAYQTAFTTRLLMTAGVVLIWFVILFAINNTSEFKGREKVLPATRIALACIFLVYLVMIHGKDAVTLYTMATNKIEAVKEKQAQRGRKAGQAIKALNQLMEEAAKQPPAPPEELGEEKNKEMKQSD